MEEGETKGYSIELPFSAESRERLLEKLREIEGGPWADEEVIFKPHLSLAVIREPTDEIEAMREIVKDFSGKYEPFKIQLSAMGIFPGKRPVFTLIPANHDGLLAAHHEVFARLDAAGVVPIPYYRKDQWTPHVTLMMGKPRRRVSATMEAMSRIWWPGEYVLDRVELIEFHPAEKLESLGLKVANRT